VKRLTAFRIGVVIGAPGVPFVLRYVQGEWSVFVWLLSAVTVALGWFLPAGIPNEELRSWLQEELDEDENQ